MDSKITLSDIQNCITQLENDDIRKIGFSEIEVNDYSETHYRLSGSVHGLVKKELWDELILKNQSLNK